MNITKEGRIETRNAANDVIKQLKEVGEGRKLEIKWLWSEKLTDGQFGFTNFMRWRSPMLRIEGGDEITDFQIEVIDDPTDPRKLSDYLKSGLYNTPWGPKEGVMLASKFKLTSDFTFPNGKLKIRTTGLTKNRELEFAIPASMKMLSGDDDLKIKLQTQSATPLASHIRIDDDAFVGLLVKEDGMEGLSLQELLLNLEFKYELIGDCAEFLKVESVVRDSRHPELKFTVTDKAKLKAKVGEFLPAENSRSLKMGLRIVFPDDLHEAIELKDIEVKFVR